MSFLKIPEILIIDRYVTDKYSQNFEGNRKNQSNLVEDYGEIFSSHRPTVVDNLEEGKRLLDSIIYDAVIVHTKIKGSEELASMYESPVIYFTDFKDEKEAKKLIEKGGAAYIHKKAQEINDDNYYEHLNQVVDKLLYSASPEDSKRVLIGSKNKKLLQQKFEAYRSDGFDVTKISTPYKLLEMLRYDVVSKIVLDLNTFNEYTNLLQMVYPSLEIRLFEGGKMESKIGDRNRNLKSQLIGVMGPRAAGKTSITYALLNAITNASRVAKDHSRIIRKGEVNGIDFNFIGEEKILLKKETNNNYMIFDRKGNLVGVDGDKIQNELDLGKNVVMTIPEFELLEWIQQNFKELKLFNVLPFKKGTDYSPSLRDIEVRTRIRGDYNSSLTSEDEFQRYMDLDAITLENPFIFSKVKREYHLLKLLYKIQKNIN